MRPALLRRNAERRARRTRKRRRGSARPWWLTHPLEHLGLEAGFPEEYQGAFVRRIIGKALVYSGSVEVPNTGHTRRITIIFNGRPQGVRPIVMADGPRTERHRFGSYRPLPLCIWYFGDPASYKWTPKDRLAGLIDLTRFHLGKEAWFRATGTWPGPERHLSPMMKPKLPKSDRTMLQRRREFKRDLRRTRLKCWCGAKRYQSCHGKLDEEHEMSILDLAGSQDHKEKR